MKKLLLCLSLLISSISFAQTSILDLDPETQVITREYGRDLIFKRSHDFGLFLPAKPSDHPVLTDKTTPINLMNRNSLGDTFTPRYPYQSIAKSKSYDYIKIIGLGFDHTDTVKATVIKIAHRCWPLMRVEEDVKYYKISTCNSYSFAAKIEEISKEYIEDLRGEFPYCEKYHVK